MMSDRCSIIFNQQRLQCKHRAHIGRISCRECITFFPHLTLAYFNSICLAECTYIIGSNDLELAETQMPELVSFSIVGTWISHHKLNNTQEVRRSRKIFSQSAPELTELMKSISNTHIHIPLEIFNIHFQFLCKCMQFFFSFLEAATAMQEAQLTIYAKIVKQ